MHPETRVEMHEAEVRELAMDYSIPQETIDDRVPLYTQTLSSIIEASTAAEVDDVVLWLKQEIRSRGDLPSNDEVLSKARDICEDRGYRLSEP